MDPTTKTQIAALIGFVALLVSILFKVQVPPEIQANITEIVGMIVLTVLYFLRASNKKIETAVGIRK
jgi:uncharacterized membrane protein